MFEFIHYAQINGGQRAGAEEKGAVKEWYIQNASFWLDIRIILRMGCERSDSKHAYKTLRSSQAWAEDWPQRIAVTDGFFRGPVAELTEKGCFIDRPSLPSPSRS
jgi:hypothetical protein